MKSRYFNIENKKNEIKITKINKKVALVAVRGNLGSIQSLWESTLK